MLKFIAQILQDLAAVATSQIISKHVIECLVGEEYITRVQIPDKNALMETIVCFYQMFIHISHIIIAICIFQHILDQQRDTL